MKKSYVVKVLSILVNLLLCIMGATISLYSQDWFGSGDAPSFLLWSIPLAVGIATSGPSIIALYNFSNKLIRGLLSIFVAGTIAFGYVYMVYLIIGPWINAFSIPIFYLWIISGLGQLLFLDWKLPKETKKKKCFRAVLGCLACPVIIALVILMIFVGGFVLEYLNRPESETYLLHQGFHGRITVVYGEEGGIAPEYENGRRILRIPENGILIIQPEPEYGLIDNEYYFVEKDGTRKRIEGGHDNNASEQYIKLIGTGTMSHGDDEEISYTHLHLFDGVSTESRQQIFSGNREHDALIRELVEQCRSEQKK